MKTVTMAIPTRGMVSMEWAMALRHLVIPDGVSLTVRGLAGYPIDDMRNELVHAFLNTKHDYLLFNDDDTCIPHNGLERLLSRNVDIVSGLYFKRVAPLEPIAYADDPALGDTEIRPLRDSEIGTGLMTVDYVGAGCLLISRKVLAAMSYPWFFWTRNDPRVPIKDKLSEDLYFCRKARENGFQVHLDCSVRCLHVGFGASSAAPGGPVKFLPSSSVPDPGAFAVIKNPKDATVLTVSEAGR